MRTNKFSRLPDHEILLQDCSTVQYLHVDSEAVFIFHYLHNKGLEKYIQPSFRCSIVISRLLVLRYATWITGEISSRKPAGTRREYSDIVIS